MGSHQFDPGIPGLIEYPPSPALHMEIEDSPVSLTQIFNGSPTNVADSSIIANNEISSIKKQKQKKRDISAITEDHVNLIDKKDAPKIPRFDEPSTSSQVLTDDITIPLSQFRPSEENLNPATVSPVNLAPQEKTANEPSQPPKSISDLTPPTPPSQFQTRSEYNSSDKGPFVVHVSRETTDTDVGSYLHPVKFGQFLFTKGIKNLKDGGIKKIGRNRLSVEFTSAAGANRFLALSLDLDKYKSFIPSYHITKTGLARNIPTDYSNDELPNMIVQPYGFGKVVKARRLNFKKKNLVDNTTQWAPSETVVLTFDGQSLPDRVFLFNCALEVVPYYFPTVQCYKCCRFGHVRAQCRSRPRCSKCAQPHDAEECSEEPLCLNCSGQHKATDKKCPEYGRQQLIKRIMGDESISYQEADKKIPSSRKPYNEVTQSTSHKKTVFIKRRSNAPANPHGYDQKAHRALIAEYSPPQPSNGVMFRNSTPLTPSPPSVALMPPTTSSIANIWPLLNSVISSLVTILQQNAVPLPSNVANNLMTLSSLLPAGPPAGPYGSEYHPMEHQEYQP